MNPLFVDSTKLAGDKVITTLELVDILLNDEDSLFIEVRENAMASKRYVVRPIKTKKAIRYRVEIFLKAQSNATYRFFVESSGKEIMSGETQAVNAGETICQQWVPISKDKKKVEALMVNKIKVVKSTRTSSLLTKDTLDQIKLFVED
jgi:hypothetical protein